MDPEIRIRHDRNRAEFLAAREARIEAWKREDAILAEARDAEMARFDEGLKAHDAMVAEADAPSTPVATPVAEPTPNPPTPEPPTPDQA